MHFTDDDISRIKAAAEGRLLDVVTDYRHLTKKGADYVCECPNCHARDKFTVSTKKDGFKCWTCQHESVTGFGALSYLMKVENKSWWDALKIAAKRFNVILDMPTVRPGRKTKTTADNMKPGSREAKGMDTDSFCARMLAASGLTFADVTAKVYMTNDTSAIFEARTFRPGTIGEHGDIDTRGDDVIIEYYDLDGLPVTYERAGKGRKMPERHSYYRVRWQYPEDHRDKDGKPFKYKSPAGSGTPVYIPERLRAMYKAGTPIHRLYIQEGEKKAEKACKHGIPSIAVSGIMNLGCRGALPEDVYRIIHKCDVHEVAFIFDADWDDLSRDIRITDNVAKRPLNFYYAAKNYREYMRSLKNRDRYVEIFIGHVLPNQAAEKGIDDLLTGSLAEQADTLAADLEHACNDKQGRGQYMQMYKITEYTDQKLKELWALQSVHTFHERHFAELSRMPEFCYGREQYRTDEDGKPVPVRPIDTDEEFWIPVSKKDKEGNEWTEYQFCYTNSLTFLQNRGFGRLRRDARAWEFVHVDPPVVHPIEADDARDYMIQFARNNTAKPIVEMLLKGSSQFVGPQKMSLLAFVQPPFLKANTHNQYFHFADKCWHITATGVQELGYESVTHVVWAEQRRDFAARYLGSPLIEFRKESDGTFSYTLSEQGKQCQFLRFLENTSNFTWRKQEADITPAERQDNVLHLLSKLCAIGFMAMDAKDRNVSRAVIAMDGKQSEVGESNGRSGKSLIGEFMRQITPLAYVGGKRKDLFDNQFTWGEVKPATKIVFIDDVLKNFDFERLFPLITGDWYVNPKAADPFTLPFEKSPKIYICTNHAIHGNDGSTTDRQWLLAFSDFYNTDHKPKDDFGGNFFSDWEFDQWNLMWNLAATCIQIYLRFGVIQAPGDRLELRKLRQEVGETFINWADEYFSDPTRWNTRINRQELFRALVEYDPITFRMVTAHSFKKRFKTYCALKGLVFNPHRYDPVSGLPFQTDRDGKPVVEDKVNGVEFFAIGRPHGEADASQSKAADIPTGTPRPYDNLAF